MLALTRFTRKLNLLELLLIAHRKFNRDILKTVDVRLWTNKRADRSDCMAPPFLWRKQPLGKSGLYSFQDSASTLITCPPDGDVSEVQHVHKVLIAHLKSESATKHRNDAFRPNAMERVCSAFTSCSDMKCYTVICMQVTIISWRCTKSPGLHTEWNKLNVETSSEILMHPTK